MNTKSLKESNFIVTEIWKVECPECYEDNIANFNHLNPMKPMKHICESCGEEFICTYERD